MSRSDVLVDTNVIVAALSGRDPLHQAARDALAEHSGRLVSCWPVLIEAFHLLRRSHGAIDALFRATADGSLLTLAEIRASELSRIQAWMRDYADQVPDLADACLVYLAGRDSIDLVLTFDRDFTVYRTAQGRAVRTLRTS